MKRSTIYTILFLILAFSGFTCKPSYQVQQIQYKNYRIAAALPKDSSQVAFLKPYHDNVSRTMNDVIGVAETSLDKKQPECTLGNFMVDAFLTMAREKYNTQVDVAFVNFGGIRLTQLPAGEVTVGKVFELMPFDNLLILQKIKGSVFKQLLDLVAEKGGWPMAGLTMQIKNKKAVNVQIDGKPLDPDATYTIANSDFIANGGDNADMLRNIPQITNGYLMRDAIIDYIKKLKSQGKNISANLENRVTNAE